ncbi:MAG: 4Fe-4S binding protein [Anaerolineales bacterium]|nr:4Fe-4S binding protein [Anaerolineales bacterium]
MTRFPLIGKLVDHFLFRGDEMYFLPAPKTVEINSSLSGPGSTILPYQVADYFINQAKYHWIMDFCLCREGDDCQQYPQQLGCIFLGEPVTQINSKLGKLVTREEALSHARRCREAGLVHTIGRNRLDSVWLGAYPSSKLMTICNCCPCCCLWGIVPQVTPRISEKIQGIPGVAVRVDENCTGCELCLDEGCFADALHLMNGRMFIDQSCRGCGRCVEVCPEGAIHLTLNGKADLEETIRRISRLVDLT